MKNGTNPVPVIFVGYAKPCLEKAIRMGVQNPVIVNCFQKIEGRQAPITAHLCGNYTELPHWPHIHRRLRRMKATIQQ